ncbi:MAG: hypothetical protein FJ290_17965 [Planctomycetes bacterium]|nr:hypothetical protein [Planctomycetota bacterium]
MQRIHHGWVAGALCALLFGAAAGAAEQAYVWWEGEGFKETNVPDPVNMRLPGNRNAEQQAKLSGGRWFTPQGPERDTPYFARYEVEVPRTATYSFWVRKFWHHGPFRWRFGEAEWRTCDKLALHDNTFLEMHWGADWVFLGEVALKQGTHAFHVELLGKTGGGAIDCFLLIDGAFTPRGKLRPGERAGKAAEGFFAWEPDADPLADGCPIDLRHLNEEAAGLKGFVRRDGDRFVLGDGRPARFWMVQAGFTDMQDPQIDRWARRLAKYGVNLVRMQLSGFFAHHASGDRKAFERELERLHYAVAALKKQGIYSYLGHLYWHTHNQVTEKMFPGFGGGQNAIALLIFSERFQKWYKDYVRAIMSPVNPYTKVPLAKEPAVAFVEIWNESSLLFWTFNPKRFPQAERDLIEKDFGDWLIAKHGSLEKAAASWGEDRLPGVRTPDRFAEGRAGLYAAGHLGGADWAASQRVPRRAADQLQWMLESTLRFYAKMKRDLRDEVGLGQMIAGSNWKTADERVLGGLERHTYTATDVVLRNEYFGPDYAKDGNKRFYAVDQGDTFKQFSSLKPPATPGPLLTPLIAGHPFMVTENNWERPLRYRAEWPFLVATYARMMGVDGWCFFALNASDWQHTMTVWDLNNPTILGQFPAAALMFRRGDVAQPDTPAVRETVSLADAYAMKGTRLFAGGGRDLLWVARIGEKEGAAPAGAYGLDPKAFFVGPVLQEFVNGPSRLQTVDLAKYIDTGKNIVRSMTGELAWDFGKGVVTVNTPRAQGATGFLKAAGRIELADIALEAGNDYGTLLAVSLDGQPLKASKRILVQAATWDQPYGFETRKQGDYERITSLGGYPLNVEKVDVRLTLKSGAGRTAAVLDENGYPTKRRAQAEAKDGALVIRLPEDAIYTLVE